MVGGNSGIARVRQTTLQVELHFFDMHYQERRINKKDLDWGSMLPVAVSIFMTASAL